MMPGDKFRCAEMARTDGYRPAGTAASAPVFLLIETPLPWPRDVGDHPLLQPLAEIAAQYGARIQGLVPDGCSPEGETRVIVYRQPDGPDGPVQPYVRSELLAPADNLAPAVADLLRSGPGYGRLSAHSQGQNGQVQDVLVCTHGSRDVCCGKDGTRVHLDLLTLNIPGVRVWRTSHTGGHRFAPTAVTFPDGRAWASVDAALIRHLLDRSLDVQEAAAHDRGCAAFDNPAAQVVDSAILAEEGWSWLDHARNASVEDLDDDRHFVTITNDTVGYRAEVSLRRVVPVPDCGKPMEEALKSSRELEVISLERI